MRRFKSYILQTPQAQLLDHRILSIANHKTKLLGGAVVALAFLASANSSAFAQTKLTPVSLSFGSLAVGATSSPKSAIFKNAQKTAVTINTIAISGGASSDYGWGGNCPISPKTLGAGLSCGITVTFTPSALGNRIAELTVSSNSPSGSQSVALSGVGIAPVTVSPTSLVFPNTLVGATSAAKTVSLTNDLNTNLVISSVATSGDFELSSNGCSSGVGPGAKCAIGVTFAPSAIGSGRVNSQLTMEVSEVLWC
jgi:hypothetical protein